MTDYLTPKIVELAERIGDEIQAVYTAISGKASLVDGKVPTSELPPGNAGEAGFSTLVFSMPGEVSETTGGVPHVLPFQCTVERVSAALSKAPTAVPIKIGMTINGVDAWADPLDRPVIAITNRIATVATPDNIGSYPAGTPIVATVEDADTEPSGGSAGTPTFDLPVATYNSLDQLVSTAVIPLPEDLAEGKSWYAWVTCGVRVTGFPAGWTEIQYVKDTANSIHGHLLHKIAVVGESATQAVTPSASAPVTIASFCLTNGGALEGGVSSFVDGAVNNIASQNLATAGLSRLGVWLFAQRLTAGATATATITSPDGAVEVSEICTTRPTTVNLLSVVATAPIPVTATLEPVTATSSGPVGRWLSHAFAAAPGTFAARSPGEDLNIFVTVREVV